MSKKKNNLEDRLSKIVREPDPLANELQMITDPTLFAFIEAICKGFLESSSQSQKSRELIARFAFAMRTEAFTRFGHDTLETFALGQMLRELNFTVTERKGRLDSISHINAHPNKNYRLSLEQQSAAERILAVWEAFGKFRQIGSRGLEGGSRSGQVLQPLDVMGDELYQHYRQYYTPWAEQAKRVPIVRSHKQGAVNLAAIIFKVLVEDFYPEQIDGAYGLTKGTGLKAVKWGLSHYWEPKKLGAWGNGSQKPREAPGLASGLGSEKAPAENQGR